MNATSLSAATRDVRTVRQPIERRALIAHFQLDKYFIRDLPQDGHKLQTVRALMQIAETFGSSPVALLHRQSFISNYTKPFFKEVYGRRPAILHANLNPLQIDVHTSIEDLTSALTSSDESDLVEGFIITEGGKYLGLGMGEQLVRAVTESRIEAARHANPLTFLPGNIPISDHTGRLLGSGREFVACYADLNQFKPYNDHCGCWRGDEMIRLVSRVLAPEFEIAAFAPTQLDPVPGLY